MGPSFLSTFLPAPVFPGDAGTGTRWGCPSALLSPALPALGSFPLLHGDSVGALTILGSTVAPEHPRLLPCSPLLFVAFTRPLPPLDHGPVPSSPACAHTSSFWLRGGPQPHLSHSGFSYFLSFVSQSFTLSHLLFSLFLSVLLVPPGHIRAALSTCGVLAPASPQDFPCPLWATAVPHSRALAFWARPGSDPTQCPGPGCCTLLPAPLTPELSPVAGCPPASSTPVWADPWPPTCTELL